MEIAMPEPPTECDLVMKGGITSGIVYPAAVYELAKHFRFRSIGGASAGAIAAGLTAAAEFARQTGNPESFTQLADEATQLVAPVEGYPTRLASLFQPDDTTRPLMALVQGILSPLRASKLPAKSPLWWLRLVWITAVSLGRSFPAAALTGIVGLSLLTVVPLFTVSRPDNLLAWTVWVLVIGLTALVGCNLGGLGGAILALVRTVPDNQFGLCSGKRGLTPWLHQTLQRLAGLPDDNPLTFGMLDTAKISLRIITTQLNRGVPETLPFFVSHRLIFSEKEFAALFPPEVVAYLKASPKADAKTPLPEGYFYLPEPENLPVVLAVRLSLSFPILISAVRLYEIQHQAKQRYDKENEPLTPESLLEVWYSDGGLTSNFPIHFFDAWLPSRPTFGINLGSMTEPKQGSVAAVKPPTPSSVAVNLPFPNQYLRPPWRPVRGLGGFLGTLFFTAKDHHDTQQTTLPSYRERIVEVRLTSDEGGLNLYMPHDVVMRVQEKGKRAGELLVERYHDDNGFDHHRWTRLRTLMAQLERNTEPMAESLTGDYATLIERQAHDSDYPYQLRKTATNEREWLNEAQQELTAWTAFLARKSTKPFQHKAPQPEGSLRITPDSQSGESKE